MNAPDRRDVVDVVIVGAGVIGVACAYTLARSGWMGCRPSLPDSLPVIDRVCHGRVLLAFGHHHLRLTQAAVTAEAIARLVGVPGEAGVPPDPLSLDLYRLDRFQSMARRSLPRCGYSRSAADSR